MIELPSPVRVVLGGPNGAGKTTTARELLPAWKIDFFLNADLLAAAIAPFAPERAALAAGRILFERQAALLERRESFAIESTLSSAQHPRRLMLDANERGYHVHLVYMWLSSDDLSKVRVAKRVQSGGHNIPEADLRRRYPRSIRNLLEVYLPLADTWIIQDNSKPTRDRIAAGERDANKVIYDPTRFEQILRTAGDEA